MHLISTEKHGSTSFAIGVDNQEAIKAFDSNLRNPGHHLARELLQVANQIQKCRQKGNYSLSMRWTAGHKGIAGNDQADREAERAVKGLSSKKNLPAYLRKPLLINPATVKRAHHESLMKKWKKEWKDTGRGQRAARLDGSTPPTSVATYR